VIQIAPGVFSVLIGSRSFTVHLSPNGSDAGSAGGDEVWVRNWRHAISLSDTRDRSAKSKKIADAGPLEIRSQMPGKVIRLLVGEGEAVQAGQGLIIVEAMKMQNEMKAPKDGIATGIRASEGATVAAGETLLVVE